ncbi:DUF4325 domain-containing protein [Rhizobium sp. J15]|nr:DUF4325 domain-containing protein [Rhizobium sp. J15]
MIDLAREFSPYPSGRFSGDGAHNGTRFRDEFLAPALSAAKLSHQKVTVDIDGVRSFGSSFLEEAFAGLIRLRKFDRDEVREFLEVRCTKPHLMIFRDTIASYITNAVPEDRQIAHH